MTPAEIAHVQRTADVLLSVGDQIADRFYHRLFELAPEVRPLFPVELRRQKVKLVETLAALVAHISHEGAFEGHLGRLGRHHAGLGVKAEHYAPVATALLDGLRAVLEDRFTPEVEAAWKALYVTISEKMIAAHTSKGRQTTQDA